MLFKVAQKEYLWSAIYEIAYINIVELSSSASPNI